MDTENKPTVKSLVGLALFVLMMFSLMAGIAWEMKQPDPVDPILNYLQEPQPTVQPFGGQYDPYVAPEIHKA